ncbi:hypothetical protein BGZ50_008252 [Haplosporangium sp. Z 11]|nr:hypothetical protein BGZ50_008252 [Haplosporangium sp. Z 11]
MSSINHHHHHHHRHSATIAKAVDESYEGGPVQGASVFTDRAIAADAPTIPAKRPLCAENPEAAIIAADVSYANSRKRPRYGEPTGAIAAVAAKLHTVPVTSTAAAALSLAPAKRTLSTESCTAVAINNDEPYRDPRKRHRSAASTVATSAPITGILRRKDSSRRKLQVRFSRWAEFTEIPPRQCEKAVQPKENVDLVNMSPFKSRQASSIGVLSNSIDSGLDNRMLEAYCNSIDFDALVYDAPDPCLLMLSSAAPSASAETAPQMMPKKERQYTARGRMALEKSR